MLNQVMIVGRLKNIGGERVVVSVPRTYKNENGEYENDEIPVKLTDTLKDNISKYCKENYLVGVKGRLYIEDNTNMILLAEKVTYLSNTEGDR